MRVRELVLLFEGNTCYLKVRAEDEQRMAADLLAGMARAAKEGPHVLTIARYVFRADRLIGFYFQDPGESLPAHLRDFLDRARAEMDRGEEWHG